MMLVVLVMTNMIYTSPMPSVLVILSQSNTCSTIVFLVTSASGTFAFAGHICSLFSTGSKLTLNWKDSLNVGLRFFLITLVFNS